MNNKVLIRLIVITIIINGCVQSNRQSKELKKVLYIPTVVGMVPESNDYQNDTSSYCFKRMIESDNLALFWHKEYGENPMLNPDSSRRFNPQRAIDECERFYNFYVTKLKMVEKGNSVTDSFKMLIYIFGGEEGTAFGGGEENKIGVLWTPAKRINNEPYGALAHELGHSFQYISHAEHGTGPAGPIIEMSAQYMLWQVYPEWMTFENYHLMDYLKGTHYAFLHPRNMYHSPYVIEYWSEKHGLDFFGKLCRNTMKDEDPVTTYKRINSMSQVEFNLEMFDASRKFITWDLKRIEKVAKHYANMHHTKLIQLKNGWYRIDPEHCPQNYGYNGIKLELPLDHAEIKLSFEGIAGEPGYNKVKTELAGWRYGFVAYLENGDRIYSDVGIQQSGVLSFDVPVDTKNLWLVVMGAPKEHWPVVFGWENEKNEITEEQWPYQLKLTGTKPI